MQSIAFGSLLSLHFLRLLARGGGLLFLRALRFANVVTLFLRGRAFGLIRLALRVCRRTLGIDFALRRATNIHHQKQAVSKTERSKLMPHRSAVLWFTGLSGAGKSTVAGAAPL